MRLVGCLLQLVEGMSTKEELQGLCRLLDFLGHEISASCNFEFVQALLRLVLQVSRSEACSTTLKPATEVTSVHAHHHKHRSLMHALRSNVWGAVIG